MSKAGVLAGDFFQSVRAADGAREPVLAQSLLINLILKIAFLRPR